MRTTTTSRRIIGIAAAMTFAASLLVAVPVSAAQRGLHFWVQPETFEGLGCINPPDCTLFAAVSDGTVSGNLDGSGLIHYDLIIDESPGGSCNIVDENATFTFSAGSIFTHSHHEDCRLVGLRINTPFTITGGTGLFIGATGGGFEFTPAKAPPFVYNGQISF